MFEVTFELNGRKVSPRNVGDALEAAVLQEVESSITRSVGALRCEQHGGRPRIRVKGNTLSDLSFEISGCCDQLIGRAKRHL